MLSIVIAARNDDHGGDFLGRLQLFVDVLLPQLARHVTMSELLVVEWNPPVDRMTLLDALEWPKFGHRVRVRLVQVPQDLHLRFAGKTGPPMYEYLAKNVGIRRSMGDYVLVTNPDILFTPELVRCLGSVTLEPQRFYRADRYDFAGASNRIRDAAIAIGSALKRVHTVHVRQVDRYQKDITRSITAEERRQGIKTGFWPGSCQATTIEDDATNGCEVVPLDDDVGPYGGIHTNASGDFLLAHRDAWFGIRGFPERTDTVSHLDSYACHQLRSYGLKQALFVPPRMILHQDHHRRGTSSRPTVPIEHWFAELQQIREGLLGPVLNDARWGIGDVALTERTLGVDGGLTTHIGVRLGE